LANAGIAQEVRQKLSGHASPEMNKRYTHHELEPLRAAIDLMPSLSVKR
jgi:integrase